MVANTEERGCFCNRKDQTMINEMNNCIPAELTGNLSDFELFLAVMKNKEAYECLLSIIMDEANLTLKEVKVEEVILNYPGKRGIRMDAWALSTDGRQFDTEMQNNTEEDDERKRSRFYQGLMDVPILKSGKQTKYKNLPTTVVIFITQKDIFKQDSVIYIFSEQCENIQGLYLNDGTKKIFLNMQSKNGRPELVSLLQYIKDTRLENPNILVLDKRLIRLDQIVKEVKQTEEWEEIRMTIMEYGMQRGTEIGKEIGIKAFVLDGIEEKRSSDNIIEKLERLFDLDVNQAKAYYLKFSKNS